jgi:hypothetical protein
MRISTNGAILLHIQVINLGLVRFQFVVLLINLLEGISVVYILGHDPWIFQARPKHKERRQHLQENRCVQDYIGIKLLANV